MLGQVRVRVADRRQQLVLGVGVPVDERDGLGGCRRLVGEQRLDELGGALAGGRQVAAPAAAALGDVDAAQEARDHLAQLVEHQLAVVAGLGQRVGAHSQQQRLERLAAAVDADVRQRRPRAACPRVASSALARVAWRNTKSLSSGCRSTVVADVIGDRREHLAVGVEQAVHVADVAGAEPAGEDRRVTEEAVAPAEPGVVGDVAGALLEVAHQPAPLEHLGQDVGRLLAGQVDAAELGDGVVAVLDEHPLVERPRPGAARRWRRSCGRRRCRGRRRTRRGTGAAGSWGCGCSGRRGLP